MLESATPGEIHSGHCGGGQNAVLIDVEVPMTPTSGRSWRNSRVWGAVGTEGTSGPRGRWWVCDPQAECLEHLWHLCPEESSARTSQAKLEGAAEQPGKESNGRTDTHIWVFTAGISLEVALTFFTSEAYILKLVQTSPGNRSTVHQCSII